MSERLWILFKFLSTIYFYTRIYYWYDCVDKYFFFIIILFIINCKACLYFQARIGCRIRDMELMEMHMILPTQPLPNSDQLSSGTQRDCNQQCRW